jgi:1-acyl-sn-glycerol-3-phosphate acyltransferase
MTRLIIIENFQRRLQTPLSYVFYLPFKVFLNWKFEVVVEGQQNIPRKGPCLIAAKQNSNYDALLISYCLWQVGVSSRFVMRDLHLPILLREPFVFLISSCFGARRIMRRREVLMDKERTKRRSRLAEAKARITGDRSNLALEVENAGHLCFFPEGTRSVGKMQPFRREFFASALSMETAILILPVGIEYATQRKVILRFGRPFPNKGDLDEIVQRCHHDVRSLSNLP